MKVLIAGGAGYIGAVSAALFWERGHLVTILDNLSTGHAHNLNSDIELIEANITDNEAIESALKGSNFDIVLNFAAKIRVDESLAKPKDYLHNNTFGVNNLVDACIAQGIKHFILSSTAAVYGEPVSDLVKEHDELRPENPYGMSKLLAEKILHSYETTHGLNWLAFRYFNAGGAYKRIGPEYPFIAQLIPTAIHALLSQKTFTINGNDYPTSDGTCVRDFVHVLDIARAHVDAAEQMIEGTRFNMPINLGSASGYSIKQVIETLEDISGQSLNVESGPRRDGDKARVIADNSLAREKLGWSPTYDLDSIIRDAWEWQSKYYQPESMN